MRVCVGVCLGVCADTCSQGRTGATDLAREGKSPPYMCMCVHVLQMPMAPGEETFNPSMAWLQQRASKLAQQQEQEQQPDASGSEPAAGRGRTRAAGAGGSSSSKAKPAAVGADVAAAAKNGTTAQIAAVTNPDFLVPTDPEYTGEDSSELGCCCVRQTFWYKRLSAVQIQMQCRSSEGGRGPLCRHTLTAISLHLHHHPPATADACCWQREASRARTTRPSPQMRHWQLDHTPQTKVCAWHRV